MANKKVVIVGGVAAGPKVAARVRRVLPNAEITIIERSKIISYAGCGMPLFIAGRVNKLDELVSTSYGAIRNEDFFLQEKGVIVLTGTEAVSINRDKKQVITKNLDTGAESELDYDKLVLATGSTPITPPIEGLNLKKVFRLYHPDDAVAIKEFIEKENVDAPVIIGSGLIGMESAEAFMGKMLFPTVVELRDQILPGILDPEMSATLKTKLEDMGMEFKLSHNVLKLEGDEEGNVIGVVTDQGTIDADMVIVAVGVRPNVELARQAGLDIGETGAIAVNEFMQTSDPDIYAAGDCVENVNIITGRKVYVPLASTANKQGRVVADNIAGKKVSFKGILGTSVLEVNGINIGRTGLSEQQARDLGYKVETAINASHDRTHYHPKHGQVILKIISDAETGRILGAQGIGQGDVIKRIDVLAAAITFKATLEDFFNIDLGYAPPFSTPIDIAAHASNILRNKLEGLADSISAKELQEKLERGDDFVLLDVRTLQGYKSRHIEDKRVQLVPLHELRNRLDEIPKDKEIVTICAMGTRSYEALRTLKGAGFNNVKYLEAGFEGWPYDYD
ncbi:FAD-dependent oxidoreductase [Desulfolucanica intricata]|uniref:FAD-dependent oxidoreductase n=1 Tax=Desulfolucanica intricata TaxID=1285191 RepID=UPI00082E669D|nr:FAD-dependent oxidoreductase [Desulfolucanica intricata]